MQYLLIPLFAILNRLRGGHEGMQSVLYRVAPKGMALHKRLQEVAVFTVVLYASEFSGWQATAQALGAALCFSAVTWAGWGRPMGALGGWERKPLKEFAPLDWLAHKAIGLFGMEVSSVEFPKGIKHTPKSALQAWGFAWLTILGCFVGLFAALILQNPIMFAAFGSIGAVYYATMTITDHLWGDAGKGWPLGEWFYGGVLGAGLAITMF